MNREITHGELIVGAMRGKAVSKGDCGAYKKGQDRASESADI